MQYPFSQQSGMSLIEVMVYLFLLTIVSTAAVGLMLSMSSLYTQYTAKQQLFTVGTVVMERLLTDIREAQNLNSAQSILASSTAATLSLNMGTTTAQYVWNGSDIQVSRTGTATSTLNGGGVRVTSIVFYSITADGKQFVRVNAQLSVTVGSYTETRTFSGGAIIRGTYEI